MRQLYGYSDEAAARVISSAETFLSEIEGESGLSKKDVALRARQNSLDAVDVAAGELGF